MTLGNIVRPAWQCPLADGLTSYEVRLNGGVLKRLRRQYLNWQRDHVRRANDPLQGGWRWRIGRLMPRWQYRSATRLANGENYCSFLTTQIEQELEFIALIEKATADFQRLYPQAPTEFEQRQLILTLAGELGASGRTLRQDGAAFGRWFDQDAIVERATRVVTEAQQRLAFYFQRLAYGGVQLLTDSERTKRYELWDRLHIETTCVSATKRRLDDRVVVATIDCLRDCISCIDSDARALLLNAELRTFVQLAASSQRFSTWVQCSALAALQLISVDDFQQVAMARLDRAEQADAESDSDIFVRFHLTQLLAHSDSANRCQLITQALDDRSPYVRQGALRSLGRLPGDLKISAMRNSVLNDPSPEVRAAALVNGSHALDDADTQLSFLRLVNESLQCETDPFVVRTAMHVSCQWLVRYCGQATEVDQAAVLSSELVDYYENAIVPSMNHLRTTASVLPLRRYAAENVEKIWMALNPKANRLGCELRRRFGAVPPGRSKHVPRELLRGLSENTIGRVLSVLSQDDFSYDLQRTWFGCRIVRGPMIRFRLWRLLFELRAPSPDKRQAFRHTVGRVSHAFLRAPSSVLSELSETKVPGEPLLQASEAGWRPYLPLVDDVLSTLNQVGIVQTTRFFTSQGVTHVDPPRNPLRRLMAYSVLTWRFGYYAKLRNWSVESNGSPSEYIAELRKLGIGVSFCSIEGNGPQQTVEDDSVLRFFPALVAIATPTWIIWCKRQVADYVTYFASIYDNSLEQLLAFAIVFACFFLARHIYLNAALAIARSKISLAIGGWGTRGKSGTERLKAALLNGMGHSVLSKSTGCEAMFLYASTYGELREFPLYRPEDKATIWEHRDTILLAAKLRASLFIWECMALRSEFVQVLQRQWTRDDLSTITNAIPDHENVQGPSGVDVAQTIATFIPRRSKLLTTENQMRPILTHVARREKTEIQSAGWLEAGMLTQDILQRFPYEEHPDNIALTLLMAKELNCDANFALKEMADRLVPDLGVLKVSPPSHISSRTVEFTNGMSANERHGCMGNWTRLGFDKQNHIDDPTVWITTVVNNRADRISRSRVFAKILVSDMSVDRHVLIGRNLNGMLTYIREAWDEQYGDFRLWRDDAAATGQSPHERLDRIAHRLRQFTKEEQIELIVASIIKAAMASVDLHDDVRIHGIAQRWKKFETIECELQSMRVDQALIDSIKNHVEILAAGLEEYAMLVEKISRSTRSNRRETEMETRDVLWKWFERKLIVVEDPRTTGEQIVAEIVQHTPPGYRNRIVGLQNIKGTGLDFVYRWQAWAQCYDACQMVRSRDLATAQAGLRASSSFEDFGLLCKELTDETIEYAERSSLARREQSRVELGRIRFNLNRAIDEAQQKFSSTRKRRYAGLIALAEDFLSVTDAIRRRKTADAIYRDLAAQRISRNRAILELRTLNKRQKDGWLAELIDRRFPQATKRSERPKAARPMVGPPTDTNTPADPFREGASEVRTKTWPVKPPSAKNEASVSP